MGSRILSPRRFRVALFVLAAVALAAGALQLSRSGSPWTRDSLFVAVRDGTRLAVDVYRPARWGKAEERALPVLWTHERYHRAELEEGEVTSLLHKTGELREFVNADYVVGVVDARGAGASFGTRHGPFSPQESLDAYDLTEWFAAQPWCDGNVGMFGRSYGGVTQYFAAAAAPPHLKAIFPEMALFDLFAFARPGGVLREGFAREWSSRVMAKDTTDPAAPVDGNEVELAAALRQHQENTAIYDLFHGLPYRDSEDDRGEPIFRTRSPSHCVDDVRRSGVAIFHLAGWYDLYPRDALAWFAALDNPQKLVIGPWSHTGAGGFDIRGERIRWFDHWLKGVDNGVMDEPPIRYYVMGADEQTAWRSAETWPLPEQELQKLYLAPAPTNDFGTANEGALRAERDRQRSACEYRVDYSTTSGSTSRWANGFGARFEYGDMTPNDEKALTFTSAPLDADLEVTGHPIVRLWIDCSADDVDLVVFLEEVDTESVSHYVTEGVLRASHRALVPPTVRPAGLPHHRGSSQDVSPLPGGPVELVLDLLPTSNVFDAGHRLRLAIACADQDNLLTPKITPPPLLSVYCGGDPASHISLPVIPASAARR